jgi:hypothetical protein
MIPITASCSSVPNIYIHIKIVSAKIIREKKIFMSNIISTLRPARLCRRYVIGFYEKHGN